MFVKAIPVKAKELRPGDLFSTAGPEYWARINLNQTRSVGEKVYIRTNTPTPADQEEVDVYQIEIER